MEIKNRIAEHNYFIKDRIECGIALKGNEVKSIRNGMINLKGSWVAIENGELYLKGVHITKWETANLFDIDENRYSVPIWDIKEEKVDIKIAKNIIKITKYII